MAQEVLINVNVSGEEKIPNLDQNLQKVQKSANKTQNEFTKLSKELRESKADMISAAEGSDKYNEALKRAAATADKLRDVTDKVKASQQDIGVVVKNVGGAIQGLGGAFATVQGVIGLFGVESDKVTQTILKMQSVLNVTQGIANFMDAFDSMKDLYNAVKLNILSLVAAKQKETVTTVQNTTANVAEATAITAVGTASKATGKAMLAALGPYALIAAAIAAVVTGVILLIKKLKEVPQDIKIKIKLEEDLSKELETKLVPVYQKVIKFATDYRLAVKSGNKDRIKELEEIGKKEFGLNEERLKLITKTRDGWREAFKEYIKIARITYKQEFYIKKLAESEVNIDNLTGELEIYRGLTDLAYKKYQKNYNKTSDEYKEYKAFLKKVEELKEQLQTAKIEQFNNNNNLNTFLNENLEILKKINELKKVTPIKDPVTPTVTTKNNIITKKEPKFEIPIIVRTDEKSIQDVNKEIAEGINEGLPKTPLFGTEEQYQLELERLGRQYDMGLISEKEYLEKKYQILVNSESLGNNLSETSYQVRKNLRDLELEDIERTIQYGKDLLYSLQDISDSVVKMYDYRLQALDNYYSVEEEKINNSTLSEEEKNRQLEKLDQSRYLKQKELFEKQKKFEIASAWINFASGLVSIWSGAYKELGPVVGPVVAGVESAALLATTIAQTQAIASQQIESPSKNATQGTSSSKGGGSSIGGISLMPTQTSMTTSEENLNMMSKSNVVYPGQNIVLVSDINNVQKTVSTRESNSSY